MVRNKHTHTHTHTHTHHSKQKFSNHQFAQICRDMSTPLEHCYCHLKMGSCISNQAEICIINHNEETHPAREGRNAPGNAPGEKWESRKNGGRDGGKWGKMGEMGEHGGKGLKWGAKNKEEGMQQHHVTSTTFDLLIGA